MYNSHACLESKATTSINKWPNFTLIGSYMTKYSRMFPAVENMVKILLLYIGVSRKEVTKIFQVECNLLFNEIFNLLLKLKPIMYPTSPRATTLQFGRCIPFLEHLAVKKTFTYLQSRKFLIVLVEDD